MMCSIWNTFHMAYFIIHVSGDATLTMGPYGSAGTCVINYAPRQINTVVRAELLFDCSSQCQPYVTINAASQSTVIPAQLTASSNNK